MNSTIFSYYPSEQKPGGLKVAIQPNMSCEGWPSNAGSRALENYTALEDATVIRLLKKAEARIVGSVHMGELGFGLAGDTGGQAVRENLADVALITDNMGEARVAAAFSGLVGFKPSCGIVSRLGLIGLIPSMECWGVIGRKIPHINSVMAVICANDEQDFSMTGETLPDFNKGLLQFKPSETIGVADKYEERLTTTERSAWKTAILAMENAGFQIETIKMPEPKLFAQVHNVIAAVEASSSAGKYDGVRYGHRAGGTANWNEMYLKSRGEAFGTLMKAYLFQGAYFQFENFAAFENACGARGHLLDETIHVFSQVDWIASLTTREKPHATKTESVAKHYEAFDFTIPASLLGLPAIQLPGIACDGNMDFGLQITGSPLSDPELLALGAYLEPKKGGGAEK